MSFEDFKNKFHITEEELSLINSEAQKEGIKFNQEEYLKSKESIRAQLKARIANSAYGSNEQFVIINQNDKELQKALTLFDEAEKINK